jgi:predicted ATPase
LNHYSEIIQSKDKTHLNKINAWLEYLGLAKKIELKRVGTSDLYDVSLALNDDVKLPIADLGYGLSQVLPVLTQCSFAPEKSTLLFEQPELHLHEGAARKLAGIFVETATSKKCSLVLETHSKELILELFTQVNEGALDVNDLAIYCVSREGGKSNYKNIALTFEEGRVEAGNDHPWFRSVE